MQSSWFSTGGLLARPFLGAVVLALAAIIASDGGAMAQVKFAVGAPFTGGSAAFGAQLKSGAEQAVEDINAAGGILGRKILLSAGDERRPQGGRVGRQQVRRRPYAHSRSS